VIDPAQQRRVSRPFANTELKWALSGEKEKPREGLPQRTHRTTPNGFPKPGGENRIVWKCMQELGISCRTTAGAERAMVSTNRADSPGQR
jgi:hypothetical protein